MKFSRSRSWLAPAILLVLGFVALPALAQKPGTVSVRFTQQLINDQALEVEGYAVPQAPAVVLSPPAGFSKEIMETPGMRTYYDFVTSHPTLPWADCQVTRDAKTQLHVVVRNAPADHAVEIVFHATLNSLVQAELLHLSSLAMPMLGGALLGNRMSSELVARTMLHAMYVFKTSRHSSHPMQIVFAGLNAEQEKALRTVYETRTYRYLDLETPMDMSPMEATLELFHNKWAGGVSIKNLLAAMMSGSLSETSAAVAQESIPLPTAEQLLALYHAVNSNAPLQLDKSGLQRLSTAALESATRTEKLQLLAKVFMNLRSMARALVNLAGINHSHIPLLQEQWPALMGQLDLITRILLCSQLTPHEAQMFAYLVGFNNAEGLAAMARLSLQMHAGDAQPPFEMNLMRVLPLLVNDHATRELSPAKLLAMIGWLPDAAGEPTNAVSLQRLELLTLPTNASQTTSIVTEPIHQVMQLGIVGAFAVELQLSQKLGTLGVPLILQR